jgi:hypothetical protein
MGQYYFASQQPLIVRIVLFFCRTRVEELANGWTGKCKVFRGRRYFVSLNRSTQAGGSRDVPEHRPIPERP